jgi:hypothetical protein
MAHRGSLVLVGLTIVFACVLARPEQVPARRERTVVTVVAEPKYYVTGASGDEELHLFTKADPKRMWQVDGFILEVVKPPEYAGQIISMHHDGVLASGNPYTLWEIGRRYEFRILKEDIGRLSFGPCSVDGIRKALSK